MSHDDSQAASQALYDLARWVDRDRVDSAHLEAYMGRLLNRLIEVHAVCRQEATVIARSLDYLSASALAGHLRELALEIEQACPVSAARRSGLSLPKLSSTGLSIDLLPDEKNRESPDLHRWPWFPEFCAALLFVAAGISLMFLAHADHALRMIAAVLYLGVGVAYATASIRLVWQKAH